MAYVSTETTRRVRGELKQRFPNLKFSVSKKDGTLRVRIMAGDLDFRDIWEDIPDNKQYWKRYGNPKPHFDGYVSINTYHPDDYNPKYTDLFKQIISIMKGTEWFDNSDPQIDYFSTAYYLKLSVGKWNKPYQYTGTPRMDDIFRRFRGEGEMSCNDKLNEAYDWIGFHDGEENLRKFMDSIGITDEDLDAEGEDRLKVLRFNNYFEEEVYRLSPDIYAEVFDRIDYNHEQLKEAYTNPSYYFSMKGSQDRMKQFQNRVRRIDENIYQRAMETAQMRVAKEEEDFEAEGEDITLKDSAKLGFGLGAGLLGFRVALFGASALVGGLLLNRK